jgi:hypothetical protein
MAASQNKLVYDHAIGESDGNGGDLQLLGNDFALVYGNENQIYLALFGGNIEQSTNEPSPIPGQNFDYWGNKLFHGNIPGRQFNSKTERTLNNTPLNSAGRVKIENAVKDDLKFLTDLGATFTVNVTLPAINTVKINIVTIYPNGSKRMTVINFGNTKLTGDFNPLDFNDDFF